MMRRYHQTFKLMAFAISVGLLGSTNSTSAAAVAAASSTGKDQQVSQNLLSESNDNIIDHTPTKQHRQTAVGNTIGPIVIGSYEEDIGDIERSQTTGKTGSEDQGAEHRLADQPLDSRGKLNEKPEPRNQATDTVNDDSQNLQHQQQQQNDPMIIDHRPQNGDSNASDDLTRTSALPSSTTTTSTTTSSSNESNNNYVTPLPVSYSPTTTTSRSVSLGSWSIQIPSTSQQQSGSIKSQQQRNIAQTGQYTAASSNQVMSSAHPSSINAIIAEQTNGNSNINNNNNNNVGQNERALPGGSMSMSSNNNIQQQQQSVPISINGQPASLVLINGAAPANGNGSPLMLGSSSVPMAANTLQGRRVSISGLLRGLGSALASLFNRRDHSTIAAQASLLNPQVVTMSTTSPSSSTNQGAAPAINNGQTPASSTTTSTGGGWLQLGPNAPHWLTQAQSAIQSLQQTQQQFLSNAASSIVNNGLASAASQNRYQILPAPQQQQHQLKPTTATLAITLPQNFVAGTQQQQMAGISSSSNQGDLQMSGSQPQYTIIQTSAIGNIAGQSSTGNQIATNTNPQQTRFDRSLKQQYVNGNNQQNLPLAHYTQYTTQISND